MLNQLAGQDKGFTSFRSNTETAYLLLAAARQELHCATACQKVSLPGNALEECQYHSGKSDQLHIRRWHSQVSASSGNYSPH